MEYQGKDVQEIALAIEEQKLIIPEEKTFEEIVFAPEPEPTDQGETYSFVPPENAEPAKTADELGLTDEDTTYLKLK